MRQDQDRPLTRAEWEARPLRRGNEAQLRAEFWARKRADAEEMPAGPGVLLERAGLS